MGGLQEQMQMLNPERSVCFFKNKTLNQSITLVGELAVLTQKSGFLASDWAVPAWI